MRVDLRAHASILSALTHYRHGNGKRLAGATGRTGIQGRSSRQQPKEPHHCKRSRHHDQAGAKEAVKGTVDIARRARHHPPSFDEVNLSASRVPPFRATMCGDCLRASQGRGAPRSWHARKIASRSMRNPSGPSIQISMGCCLKMAHAKLIASAGTA
jgi:hypothetical protein